MTRHIATAFTTMAIVAAAGAALSAPAPAQAQWTNQYPRVTGYGHQLYLEQEHLPILSSGPVYPAAAPDGRRIAFAHQGWIWLLDLETWVARRVTDDAGVDGRPRWSPDGTRLAFVRDTGSDTHIVILRLADGVEETIDSPALELDPEFSHDGGALFYASARGGPMAIWRRSLADGAEAVFSQGTRVRRGPRALADGRVVFQSEDGAIRSLRLAEGAAGGAADGAADGAGAEGENGAAAEAEVLVQQGWMAHLEPDVHPTGQSLVYALADGNELRLAVMDVARPEAPRWLTAKGGRALHPTFSADGRTVFFIEADASEQFALYRVDAAGGVPAPVAITRWDYGAPTGSVAITARAADGAAVPARVSIRRADGHPVVNPAGATYLNNQDGTPYFYIDGAARLTLPAGSYRAVLSRGPFSVPEERSFTVGPERPAVVEARIGEIWNAAAAGYASADLHVHLNASGVHELALEDLLLPMRAEALDYAAPMAWNQYNRFIDADRVGQRRAAPDGTTAVLSQEVRSDFHGHVGMIGLAEAYHPWFFGPGTPTYTDRDYHNGQAIAFAAARGALPSYVHPVGDAGDPFDALASAGIPPELVIDGVLTPGIGIEIVCQWTSALGTSEVWYRLLNIGRPVVATSGTDMMANFYRTPAIGTARSYIPQTGPGLAGGFEGALAEVRKGTGFVTTGPALMFSLGGRAPGGVVYQGSQEWSLELASVQPVERVEIIVNGAVVETLEGFAGGGSRTYRGTIDLPDGGWVAARAVGGGTGGPSMTVFPFAHSSPIWIEAIGSTDPAARRAAARDLIAALD